MDVIGIVGVAAGSVSIPLTAVAASTAVVGISQGVSSQQKGGGGSDANGEADKSDPRLAKFNLYAQCPPETPAGKHVHGKVVVLRKGKLYLDAADPEYRIFSDGHPFSGFYLEYPVGEKPLGLVSTISCDPPELNWIYIDDDTLELKYGNKTDSMNHIPGPWDWTADQKGLMLEEWEGFVAVEESPGVWGLHYDQDDDQLSSSGLAENRRVVECSLQRQLQ